MDLHIAGKNAFICASSQGLGLACAQALVAEGVNIILNGRHQQKLDEVANSLRQHYPGAQVNAGPGAGENSQPLT